MSLALLPLPAPRPIGRRARRGASPDHGFEIVDSIAAVDAAAWDRATAAASLFLRRPYLAALEAARPGNLEPRYALVYRGRECVAAVAAQLLELDGAQAFRGAAVPGLRARLLICGNVLSWGTHGAAFAPGRPPAELWPAVVEALGRIERGLGVDAVVIKDLSPPSALVSTRFRPRATEPDMVLDFPAPWRAYDDYLAALKTRYRRAALRVARRVEEAGCRVERLTDFDASAERLHALFLRVHEAARVRLVTAPASYLPALAAAFPAALRCTVIRRGGEIVGFVTTLRDGDTAVGYHLGFDRELGSRVSLYPRLLHAAVADALALGCRRLSLGRTALESKARLGAQPRPLCVWHRSRGLKGRLLGWMAVIPSQKPPERRPFKKP